MKKAFTMLELIMVIVVVGILAAVVIPRTDANSLREAAIQVISDIRYAQHLAMVDDQFNINNNNWFMARWQIFFHLDNSGNGNEVYTIYSDTNLNNSLPANGEIALDPVSRDQMTGNSVFNNRTESMDLTGRYGIVGRVFNGGCVGVQGIMFDHLGRPHTNDTGLYNNLLTAQCQIVFTSQDGTNITILIEPETGYVHSNDVI